MGDERAKDVLANGRAFLQRRAALIQDRTLRQSLLEDHSTNRQFNFWGLGNGPSPSFVDPATK
jgi:hypothetical protein